MKDQSKLPTQIFRWVASLRDHLMVLCAQDTKQYIRFHARYVKMAVFVPPSIDFYSEQFLFFISTDSEMKDQWPTSNISVFENFDLLKVDLFIFTF